MKRTSYLAIIVFSSLFCCSANAESPQPTANLISTPFGLRPPQCVHKHASGTLIRETAKGVEAIAPDGSVKYFPALKECIDYDKQWKASTPRFNKDLTVNGWLDNAYWYTPQPATSLTGLYRVPNTPASGPQGFWLYYFMGLVNFQSNVVETILQPVLTYSNTGWTIASWNCCPSGQSHVANPVPTSDNAVVAGSMVLNGTTWTVDSISAGQHSTLQVDAMNRVFNYADATLETYYTTGCSNFPTAPAILGQMVLTLTSGIATPNWAKTGPTICNGVTTIKNPARVFIQHN